MEGPERGPWVDATGRWRHYLRHPASLNLSLLIHYRLPAPTFDFLYFSKRFDPIFFHYQFVENVIKCFVEGLTTDLHEISQIAMIRQFLFLKIYPSKSDLFLEEKKFPISPPLPVHLSREPVPRQRVRSD